MRADDSVLRCVCFVGYDERGRSRIGGTGFLVEFDQDSYLVVTARHNVDLIRHFAPGHPVVLWMNGVDGKVAIETDPNDWLSHPSDPAVDVAVYKHPVHRRDVAHFAIPRSFFITDEYIEHYQVGAGDDLYFPGLFARHQGTRYLQPIVRQGTIAALAADPVATQLGPVEGHLVEVRSIGGFSGSPVILHMDMWRVPPGASQILLQELGQLQAPHAFLGLVHGHFDAKALLTNAPIDLADVNMGIAVVVPAQRILEVVTQPEVEVMKEEAGERSEAEPVPAPDFGTELDGASGIENTAKLLGDLSQVPKDEARARAEGLNA